MTSSFPETFYADLRREYDLTLDRRKTLTSQASSLMGFAGLVQAILGSLIVAFATNASARQTFEGIPDHEYVLVGFVIGLLAFTAAAFSSLFAFVEEKWYRVPFIPDANSNEVIGSLLDSGDTREMKLFAYQLNDATIRHQAVNNTKFDRLRVAQIAIVLGVASIAIAGIIVLASL